MSKKNIIIVIILLLILCCILTLVNKDVKPEENQTKSGTTIENLKYQTGATADDSLYEIKKDLSGREVLEIKDELEYKVALAGILKQEKPTYENLEETIQMQNIHSGIWVSSESRQEITSIIDKYLEDEYIINEEGYLELKTKTQNSNSYDKNMQKCMQNNKTYIISILGEIYKIDNMTGEIELYPFEQMDAYQLCEPVEYEKSKIIVLSKNEQKQLETQEIIEAMIEQMVM